uniref:Histone-lysine N-methyltransferase n=2 Tax=Setaria italica TaxID=4555 RepID=K3ZCJ1_SETIT
MGTAGRQGAEEYRHIASCSVPPPAEDGAATREGLGEGGGGHPAAVHGAPPPMDPTAGEGRGHPRRPPTGNGRGGKGREADPAAGEAANMLYFIPSEYGRTMPLEYQHVKRGSNGSTNGCKPKMQESGAVLYTEKRIGHLPGIDVGDQFYSRAEMVALGIHSHWLNGIDYMGMKYRDKKGCEDFTFPLATCIVLSGVYEDDVDNANEIIYTGEGGNNWLGNRQQKTAQTLLRGNLALKNSMDNGNPVRVIRGHVEKSSYTGKVYTYDGLYKVVDFLPEKGVRGELVFKYRLKRLEGQPPLTTSQVLFTRGDVPMPISELPGLVCRDMSNGQESFPIPATNLVDNPPVPPSGFVYSKSLQIPEHIKIPIDRIGCNCSGDCSTSEHCLCAKRNGSELPYVSTKRKNANRNDSKHSSVGRLVEPKAVVYECGTNCTCHCNCVNRTSQQGLKLRLEVFKTESKGWGVRTWDTILPGALICEYTGVLRRTTEVEGLLENNYIFDIDCLQTIKGLDGREQRAGSELHIASLHSEHDSVASQAPEYCIDAGSVGNIARFINHSCQPNLFIQCVLSSHSDIKLAKIMLFAADTIPPLHELSYDYGYHLDSVTGADDEIVKLACHCGAPDCRKRLY